MATFVLSEQFVEDLAKGVHNLDSDTFKAVLTNVEPDEASDFSLTDLTQIANGNGYTTDGETCGTPDAEQTSGTLKFTLGTDPVWTASGGSMAAFQWVVIYNDTSTGDKIIGFCDYGSEVTLAVGETFTFNLDQSNGVLTIT